MRRIPARTTVSPTHQHSHPGRVSSEHAGSKRAAGCKSRIRCHDSCSPGFVRGRYILRSFQSQQLHNIQCPYRATWWLLRTPRRWVRFLVIAPDQSRQAASSNKTKASPSGDSSVSQSHESGSCDGSGVTRESGRQWKGPEYSPRRVKASQ